MNEFTYGMTLGLFIGAIVAILFICLLAMSKRADEMSAELEYNKNE